jgi:ribosome-binding factor A
MRRTAGRAGRGGEPGQRQLRVGEEIRHVLAELFARGGAHDSALRDASLTVTEVRMSPDLRHATAYVTPLGRTMDEETLERLRREAPRLSGEVARRVRLKFAPRIRFEADMLFDEAARIESVIRAARATHSDNAEDDQDEPPGEDAENDRETR